MSDLLSTLSSTILEPLLTAWRICVGWCADGIRSGVEWLNANALPVALRWDSDEIAWTQTAEFHKAVEISLTVIAIFLMLFALYALFRDRDQGHLSDLSAKTRRPRIFALIGIVALIAFFGGWSALAPLAGAAMAPGVVSPDGNRKTVKHLEGGIVRTVHVGEGDYVETGQPLVTLADVQAKAQFAQLRKRYLHLLAMEARLLAERSALPRIEFPPELTASSDADALQAVQAQNRLFESRKVSLESHRKILNKRIRQLQEQNIGMVDVLAAQGRQLDLLDQEIESVQTLLDAGLERLPRLLTLHRKKAELEADKASVRAKIAENDLKVGETEIQLLTIGEQVVDETNDELSEIQRVIAEVRSQLPSREDILDRTIIRAPLSGRVINLRATTESGVISPGEPILEIVPQFATLVVDAKIRPNDIDRVHTGMEARVLLTAYKQRNLPLIHGTLGSISADRLVEDRTGEPYFLAQVEVREEDLKDLGDVRMLPGMPADVMLLDAEQTFLAYLFDPFLQSLERSFREN